MICTQQDTFKSCWIYKYSSSFVCSAHSFLAVVKRGSLPHTLNLVRDAPCSSIYCISFRVMQSYYKRFQTCQNQTSLSQRLRIFIVVICLRRFSLPPCYLQLSLYSSCFPASLLAEPPQSVSHINPPTD